MARSVDGATHRGDIGGDARGGLVMDHHDALDLMVLVGAQRLFDALRRGARAPLFLLNDDLKPMTAGEFDPQMAELAEARRQQLVAGRAGIGEGGLPGARAARRKDEDLAFLGLENLLHVVVKRQRQLGEVGGPVILHRHVHGAQNALGNIGWSRHKQKVTARPSGSSHGFLS